MINLRDFVSGNPNLFKQFKVNDLLFVEYLCLAEDDLSEIWSHSNYFVYVLGGKKKWKTAQEEYLADSGNILFVKKGANAVYQYFEEKFLVLLVFVPDEFIRAVIEKYEIGLQGIDTVEKSDAVIHLQPDESLQTYFGSLLSYFLKASPPSQVLLKIKFEELIVSILSDEKHAALAGYFKELCTESRVPIAGILESNFSHPLTLEEYARLCARSLSTFKRDFYTLYGIPPGKWLTERRLQYSHYLLRTTSKTIDEIMFESGFKNRSHFVKAFKEKYGTTPVRFRNRTGSIRELPAAI